MSQHDYVIDNAAGSIFRSDLNGALAAIASHNSGASAPSATFAYMFWADTTSGWLKQRNSTNTSWISVERLSNGSAGRRPVSSRSSNTILAEADFGSLIRATSAFTQTLTAAATLGDGWWCSFRNDSASSCTIDPNASETIDGGTTLSLAPSASISIHCNGSAFYSLSGASSIDTGSIKPWPAAAIPTGWLECDGSAVSRTTYASLFVLISTTYGTGDGSTTFNLPDLRGRVPVGVGTPTDAEAVAAAAVDPGNSYFLVASNNYRWITGQPVTLSTSGTLPAGLAPGSYFIVKRLMNAISFSTTLANAQAGVYVGFSGTGTGTHTITNIGFNAKTLAERGGEEAHAQSATELFRHAHQEVGLSAPGGGGTAPPLGTGPISVTGTNTAFTGGNVATPNMQPYLALKWVIKT